MNDRPMPPQMRPQLTISLSQGLFNKIINVLAELPFKNVGGIIGEIQQELSGQQQLQQRTATMAELMRGNAGPPAETQN
jgi:hypothetical protein